MIWILYQFVWNKESGTPRRSTSAVPPQCLLQDWSIQPWCPYLRGAAERTWIWYYSAPNPFETGVLCTTYEKCKGTVKSMVIHSFVQRTAATPQMFWAQANVAPEKSRINIRHVGSWEETLEASPIHDREGISGEGKANLGNRRSNLSGLCQCSHPAPFICSSSPEPCLPS